MILSRLSRGCVCHPNSDSKNCRELWIYVELRLNLINLQNLINENLI